MSSIVFALFLVGSVLKLCLQARNKITEEAAESRLAAQISSDEKRAYAHVVIDNNSGLKELNHNIEEAVNRLEQRYRKLSAFEVLDVVKSKHGIHHAKRAVIVNFGLTTRCSYVVIKQASSGNYFVQVRSALKDSFPGKLDPAPGKYSYVPVRGLPSKEVNVGGHCDRGESYEACGAREIKEEMGLELKGKLQYVGDISVFQGYGVEGQIFSVTVDCEVNDLNVDETEVAGVLLKSPQDILNGIETDYIPDGLLAFKEYAKNQGSTAQAASSI